MISSTRVSAHPSFNVWEIKMRMGGGNLREGEGDQTVRFAEQLIKGVRRKNQIRSVRHFAANLKRRESAKTRSSLHTHKNSESQSAPQEEQHLQVAKIPWLPIDPPQKWTRFLPQTLTQNRWL